MALHPKFTRLEGDPCWAGFGTPLLAVPLPHLGGDRPHTLQAEQGRLHDALMAAAEALRAAEASTHHRNFLHGRTSIVAHAAMQDETRALLAVLTTAADRAMTRATLMQDTPTTEG
jgi:hypothetical protein